MGESRRKNKPGQEKVTLDREQKEWLREQLDRPIYSTMAPGKKDNVYKGKVDGEKQYEQKRFLLWPLRDLHDSLNGKYEVANENSFVIKFDKKLPFGCFYDFIKANKEYKYN